MNRLPIVLIALLLAAPLHAQNANQTQLRIVVVDETGAGIPSASITVTPQSGDPVSFESDERGVATSPTLATGTVQLHVEFPGFEPHERPLTLRRGAMNQTVTLKIAGVQEEVVVSDNSAVDDRRGNSMSTTLQEDEILELPDDPDELADVLAQMAGGSGVVFQVNGFRGGRLPSRDEIQQIRFRTNSFSADNHDAGRTQVEIITRPNVRQWSGNANLNYRSDAMNARNALAQRETPETIRGFNFGARGPLVAGKTSVRLGVDGRRNIEADTIVAKDVDGFQIGDYVRRPSEQTNFTFGVEHALANTQTLRMEVRRNENFGENLGVGGFNLPERAYSRERTTTQVRTNVQSVIGRNMLNEVRLQYNQQSNLSTSFSSAPTISVLDTFVSGGAGVNSNGSSRTFELSDDFDFNVGRNHQMRVGLQLEGGNYRNFDARNAAGTFTFSPIPELGLLTAVDAFLAGQPSLFTRREGQVNTAFSQYQFGIYWQDDIRVNNKLSVSVGVRNELQTHVNDRLNLMPRFGFTWTPWGSRTSIRGGYGLYHDWYESDLYDQTLRVDGISQRDLQIFRPGYPDPTSGTLLDVRPGGRIEADPDLRLPKIHQSSIGIERQVTQTFTLQANYQMLRGSNQLRSRDINAPVPITVDDRVVFVRPDPTIGSVTRIESTGESRSDRLQMGGQFRFPQLRLFMGGNYTLSFVKNHADGATRLPANSFDPDAEWGPSSQDIRHRAQMMANVPLLAGFRANFQMQAQSASPYTITTGRDDNGDGSFTDRPAGVGRNTARGLATWNLNMRLSRVIGLGGSRSGGGGRIGGFPQGGDGGGPANQVGFAQGQGGGGRGGGGRGGGFGGFGNDEALNARYTMELFIAADNVLNRVNYAGFSGNQGSPFFGLPTMAQAPRRVQLGMQFRF